MIVKPVKLKFKGDVSTFVWTADWHEGCKSFKRSCLDMMTDRILSKGWLWAHGADAIDGIIPGDKRHDVESCQTFLLDQLNTAIDDITAINKTCVGMLEGNHESAPSKLIGSVSRQICRQAKIPFLTQTCYLRFQAPRGECVAFLTHCLPSITNNNPDPLAREAARTSRLQRVLRPFDADLKLGAHIHTFLCHPPVAEDRLVLTSKNEVKKRGIMVHGEWNIVSPAMFVTYGEDSNYAQAKLYKPTDIGWAEIDFNRKGEIVEVRNVLDDGTTKRAYHPILVD
jgi:hypothetical protein